MVGKKRSLDPDECFCSLYLELWGQGGDKKAKAKEKHLASNDQLLESTGIKTRT